ncbi:MAG: hypothetical protein WD048_12485 [Chitinophagales bacterium]
MAKLDWDVRTIAARNKTFGPTRHSALAIETPAQYDLFFFARSCVRKVKVNSGVVNEKLIYAISAKAARFAIHLSFPMLLDLHLGTSQIKPSISE